MRVMSFLARLYESSERVIALPPASALALALSAALTKMLKFYVKIFKTDFVYIWYGYRCWSKILLSTIQIPAHDIEDKVTNLVI